ncbi:lasso RiPP family leader peptide-containing protein [Amycolatopsis japonica]
MEEENAAFTYDPPTVMEIGEFEKDTQGVQWLYSEGWGRINPS